MLWIVDAPRRGVIVAARSAAAARAAVWQAGPAAYASDEEIRQFGDVIIVADAVAPAEEDRLQRLLG